MGIEQIKEDWEDVKRRYEAWWQQKLHDRPLVCVTAPKDNVLQSESAEEIDETESWNDVNAIVRAMLTDVESTYYGGEAIPVFFPTWAGMGSALYFGCKPHFSAGTVWVRPAPVGEDGFPSFDGWRESPWLDRIVQTMLSAAKASKGRHFVPATAGGVAGEDLAMIRGAEALLLDIVLNPEWLKWAVEEIADIQMDVLDELLKATAPEIVGVEGSSQYCLLWSPGKSLHIEFDSSCMMSTKHYAEFFLPSLIRVMRKVDHRIYHLDGPGAIKHLDVLLEVPELQAIDWVPGAGTKPGALQWIPLVQRVQSKGKGIKIDVSLEEIEPFMREVKPEGLCINTWAGSEAEAREVVGMVEELTGKH